MTKVLMHCVGIDFPVILLFTDLLTAVILIFTVSIISISKSNISHTISSGIADRIESNYGLENTLAYVVTVCNANW